MIGGVKVNKATADAPPREAVIVAPWLFETAPAVAVNVAVVLDTPTVTELGTVSVAALLDSVTVAPPVFEIVTVQVEVAPEARLVGVHARLLRTAGALSEMVAVCVLPFRLAVTVAV